MDTSLVINIARKGSGFKGWYLNKTLGGKCLIRRALAKQYGKRKNSFDNGVAKYEKKISNGVETRYISNKLKPFLTKLTKFGEDGRKTSQSFFYQNPDNPRQRTSMSMNDYHQLGKRIYVFNKYSYNEITHGWNLNYQEQTTMNYDDTAINIKSVINDYIAKTSDIIEKVFMRKISEK